MSKINIVLSSSQQAWNKCLEGDTERDHCFLIVCKVADILRNYNANVCVIPKLTGTESFTLSEVCRISNNFISANGGKGFHLDIHTDAGYNGAGASGFYVSEGGKAFTLQIHKEISRITPWGDGDVKWRELYVLINTIAIAGLIEVSFHDKPVQAKWIHMNINNIAAAIVKGLEAGTGIVKNSEIMKSDENLTHDVEVSSHPAEESYQKLVNAGRDIKEKRFEDPLTRGEYFILEAEKISKVWI